MSNYSFEDKIEIINTAIAKKRKHWQLNALSDIDYNDVSQIIRLHIWKKWDKWDQSKPLENWLHRVIHHQIINLIRNNYGRFAPPCQGSPPCPCNQGGNLCSFTRSGVKDVSCPLYAKWAKTKQSGYNIKLATSINEPEFIESNDQVHADNNVDLEDAANKLHAKMKEKLKPTQWRLYRDLFILYLDEKEIAAKMGYKTQEEKRNPGYKQINNIKRKFAKMAKEILEQEDIIYG